MNLRQGRSIGVRRYHVCLRLLGVPHTGQRALAAFGMTLIITEPSGSMAKLAMRQRSVPTSRSSTFTRGPPATSLLAIQLYRKTFTEFANEPTSRWPLTPVTLIDSPATPSGYLAMTLARLTDEFLHLADALADSDPSDPEALSTIEALLDQSTAAIRDKAAAAAAIVREFDARAAAAQAEGERILAHAHAAKARASWLRSYLFRNLQALGLVRLETATTVLAIRQSPPSVEVVNEDQIPGAFKHFVASVNKIGLRTALLNGEIVPGARLVRGSHLVLR